MTVSEEIENLLTKASKLADDEIERLARQVLKSHPKKLNEFIMGMGSYFFTRKNGATIHNYEKDEYLKLKGCKELEEFINTWDHDLKVTGSPMRFTATGPKITDW